MGRETALALPTMIESGVKAARRCSRLDRRRGVGLIVATGVFGEVPVAMNQIWEVGPGRRSILSRLVRACLVSLGLVVTAGFLLLVSLAASAALLRSVFPAAEVALGALITFLVWLGRQSI